MPSQTAMSTGMGLVGFLPFLFIILIFYFVLIRPQMKKEKESEKMRENLKKGDNVVTVGGICGSVLDFKGDRVVIQADINTKLTVLRSSISVVQTLSVPVSEPAPK
jgi:preprotein translocase subunit YajC